MGASHISSLKETPQQSFREGPILQLMEGGPVLLKGAAVRVLLTDDDASPISAFRNTTAVLQPAPHSVGVGGRPGAADGRRRRGAATQHLRFSTDLSGLFGSTTSQQRKIWMPQVMEGGPVLLTDAAARVLARLTALRRLRVSHADAFTDAGLAHLSTLTRYVCPAGDRHMRA